MTLWQRSRAIRVISWIALAIVVVFVLPWGYLYWRTERDLQAELTRIRDAGEPTSLSDLLPPQIPDEENAAVVYDRFRSRHGDSRLILSFAQADEWRVAFGFVFHGSREADTRRALSRAEVRNGLESLREASRMKYAITEGQLEQNRACLSDPVRTVIDAARWTGAQAIVEARDGNTEEALEWLRVVFRMTKQLASDPCCRSSAANVHRTAVGAAWQVLEDGEVSAEQARSLMPEVWRFDPWVEARGSTVRSRVSVIEAFRSNDEQVRNPIFAWALDECSAPERWLVERYDSVLLRPVRNADLLGCLQLFRCTLETIDAGEDPTSVSFGTRPYGDGFFRALTAWADNFPPIAARYRDLDRGRGIVRGHATMAVESNGLLTGLALVAHKREHGEYPRTLGELALPAGENVTMDLCSGKPLHYRRDGDGFVLYSVGPNGLDESGGGDDIAQGVGR